MAGQLRLPKKAPLVVGQLIGVESGSENNLDGDRPADNRVVGFIHHAHRAASQLINNFVAPHGHRNRIYGGVIKKTNLPRMLSFPAWLSYLTSG